MLAFADLAANCGLPVLLSGETGSGKTFLAREIHLRSARATRSFVRVNCAAVPDTLFEREMFGHVRGAYTDAREPGTGFFEAADGGILFLDEVGEIPLVMQPKLLAALEEGCFRKLGSPREIRVDTRIIAATNCDLAEMVRQKRFRQDLYYRFSVLQYRVPPLRERRDEIPSLVTYLLHRSSAPEVPSIAAEALDIVLDYPWPGNIRELENALAAAVVFARGGTIRPQHLPPDLHTWHRGMGGDGGRSARDTPRYTAPDDPQREIRTISEALRAAGGNKAAAARRLGMSRSTLWAKLKAYSFLDSSVTADVARDETRVRQPCGPGEVASLLISPTDEPRAIQTAFERRSNAREMDERVGRDFRASDCSTVV